MTTVPIQGSLDLPAAIRDQMLDHARSDVPYETCGLLGSDGQGQVRGHWPVANVDRSMTWFRMDPQDQLRAMKAMDAEDLEWSGIWHCHTHTEAFPSDTDIEQSKYWPGIVTVIVSLQDPDPIIRAYDITDGQVNERVLTVDGKDVPGSGV